MNWIRSREENEEERDAGSEERKGAAADTQYPPLWDNYWTRLANYRLKVNQWKGNRGITLLVLSLWQGWIIQYQDLWEAHQETNKITFLWGWKKPHSENLDIKADGE